MAAWRDGRPRHEQVAAEIRAEIMAGALPPGTQLPSTPNLVSRFSAANATIQRALATLKDEGLLHSHAGKGVYVRDHQPLAIEAAACIDPAPGTFTYDLLGVSETQPPPDVAKALQLAEGAAVVLRHRLLRHGADPVEISWSYYPASLARGTALADSAKIKGGAPRVLAALGFPQRDFIDRVAARMPTTEEAALLELPDHVPVIRQFRVVRTDAERPVEVSILIKSAHRYELRYHRQI